MPNPDGKYFIFTKEIFVENIQPYEKGWSYKVIIRYYPGLNHQLFYHSKNKLALTRTRNKLLSEIDQQELEVYQSSYWKSIKIKPTLLEKIKESFMDNTK